MRRRLSFAGVVSVALALSERGVAADRRVFELAGAAGIGRGERRGDAGRDVFRVEFVDPVAVSFLSVGGRPDRVDRGRDDPFEEGFFPPLDPHVDVGVRQQF